MNIRTEIHNYQAAIVQLIDGNKTHGMKEKDNTSPTKINMPNEHNNKE